MYHLIRDRNLKQLLSREAPTGLAAMVVAEFFYKFHSFTLECLAFLTTWLLLGYLLDKVAPVRRDSKAQQEP